MAAKSTIAVRNAKHPEAGIRKTRLLTPPVIITCVVLVGLVLACFYRTFSYGFVDFDDKFLINGWFKGASINVHDFVEVFKHQIGDSFYRPVLAVTVVWDEGIGGISPRQYHLTNLLLYAFASVLVYLFLLKLSIHNPLAATLAFIFAVHPLNTPAAAWIFGRNEPLLAIFFLLSMLFLVLFCEATIPTRKRLWILFHLFFYLVSLYCKETALIIPVIFLSFTYLVHRDELKKRNVAWLPAAWLIFSLIWLWSRRAVLSGANSPDVVGWEALLKNWKSFFALTGKILFPQHLALTSLYDTSSIFTGVLFLIVLLVLSICPAANSRQKIFGLIWFVLFLLPPLFIASRVDFDYAEHRAFIPMIGLLILIGTLTESFKIDCTKYSFRIAAVTLFLILLGRTQLYVPVFANPTHFWGNLAKTYPDRQIAYAIAGNALFNAGLKDESVKMLTEGEDARVKNCLLYQKLSAVYLDQNDPAKSEYYARKGIAFDPGNSKLYDLLSQARLKQNDSVSAIQLLRTAIEKDSKNADALTRLAQMYLDANDDHNAIPLFEKAIAVDKANTSSYNNLGGCYYRVGNVPKAEEAWREAIKGSRFNNDAFNNLIMLYLNTNREKATTAANELIKRGGQLKPVYKKALFGEQ